MLRHTAAGRQMDDLARADSLSPELQEAIKALMRVEARRFLTQSHIAGQISPLLLDAMLACLRGEEPKKP